MSIISRFGEWFGGSNADGWRTIAAYLGGVQTSAGESITPDTAMQVSAYYACIRAVSEDVAKLPLFVYERGDNGKTRATDHPLFNVLHRRPNPYMTSIAYRETMTAHALGWGNAYAEIQYLNNGDIAAYWPIHPSRVEPFMSEDSKLSYKIYNDDNTFKYLDPEFIFHLHGLGSDGISGYTVAQIAAESLGVAVAQQRFAGAYYGNGAHMGGAIEMGKKKLSPEAQEMLRRTWGEVHQGAKKAFKVGILEEGMKWHPTAVNPKDSQFIEGRQFSVEEICRWFRIPPHKIQHLQRATFSNIEHQGQEYLTDTLLPWLERWEQALDNHHLDGGVDYFAEHNVEGLLRGDSAARAAFYKALWEMGALNADEIRAMENRNPIPGGDVYYRPMNFEPTNTPRSPE